ncbi:MAG: hypothetical protein FJ088_09665, partial [Deltaproteobacteria bacterium]|nr:hypothetical protein [Deltaproteobacteria bacterium]
GAIELLNEKRLELIRTPTVEEVNDFNACFREINAALDKDGIIAACSWMKKMKECSGSSSEKPKYCKWYERFAAELKKCGEEGGTLPTCKEFARSALTKLSVRALIERTPAEQDLILKAIGKGSGSESCDLKISLDPSKRDALPDEERASPCSKHEGVIDDWFNLLNHGVKPTGMGNSDSHDAYFEAGYPRNYIKSSSDFPGGLDRKELMKNIQDGAVSISSGPFIRFRINGADIGATVKAAGEIRLYVQVQTPSWFGIDRIEIYRNGGLFKFIELDNPVEVIEDYEGEVVLKKGDADFPAEDSWFVVIAYGLEDRNFLSPVYTSIPLGKLQLPKLTSLAFSKLPLVGDFLGEDPSVPDFFPLLPYSVTNPIWVDLDNDGNFKYLNNKPVFCPRECAVVKDDKGEPQIVQSDCPKDNVCYPGDELGKNAEGDKGTCGVYIEGECVAGGEFVAMESGPLTQDQMALLSSELLFQSEKIKSPFHFLAGSGAGKKIDRFTMSKLLMKKLMFSFRTPNRCGL